MACFADTPQAGLLLWSMYCLLAGRGWAAGALYTVLLHTKHLYVYCAPVYFAHLLIAWCFGVSNASASVGGRMLRGCGRLAVMGSTVLAISVASLYPIYKTGQLENVSNELCRGLCALQLVNLVTEPVGMPLLRSPSWVTQTAVTATTQLLERLFPFGRGLTHSYWAANAWALYMAADKAAGAAFKRVPQHVLVAAANRLPEWARQLLLSAAMPGGGIVIGLESDGLVDAASANHSRRL
jgi:alpha-1,3-glucosyltransferase